MIPISDDNPTRLLPFVTCAIIALCILIYLWERSLGPDMDNAIFVLGFIPSTLFGHRPASPFGFASFSPVATIFTSMFLHAGVLHVAGNMLFLWIFGNNVEDAMGHWRFILFYFACGIAAALALAVADPASGLPMVGASGAIAGVLAAYMLLFPQARVTVLVIVFPVAIRAIWVVGFWFAMQILSATGSDPGQSGIAWWAHIGGFTAGLALTPFLKSRGFPLFGRVRRGPWTR